MGHGDANMHLQLFYISQNSDEAEWLASMGIVGIEGYLRPAMAFQWLNILHIGPRRMIIHHHKTLGLGHDDANLHLQLFHIGQKSDEEEWLVNMGIVGFEGYVRQAIALQ